MSCQPATRHPGVYRDRTSTGRPTRAYVQIRSTNCTTSELWAHTNFGLALEGYLGSWAARRSSGVIRPRSRRHSSNRCGVIRGSHLIRFTPNHADTAAAVRHSARMNPAKYTTQAIASTEPITSPAVPVPIKAPAPTAQTRLTGGLIRATRRKRHSSSVASLPTRGYQVASKPALVITTQNFYGRSVRARSVDEEADATKC